MAVSAKTLQRCSFFPPLDESALASLALCASKARCLANATIFLDQQIGYRFYLLLAGSVQISKPSPDGIAFLNLLKPGDHFGEMSLLDDQSRSTSARAATDVIVIEFPKTIFLWLIERFPLLLQATHVSDQRLQKCDLALIDHLAQSNNRVRILYETSLAEGTIAQLLGEGMLAFFGALSLNYITVKPHRA